jgi:hypothetical protein
LKTLNPFYPSHSAFALLVYFVYFMFLNSQYLTNGLVFNFYLHMKFGLLL